MLIFPEDLIRSLTKWTQERALETIDVEKKKTQKKGKWNDLTLSEMKCFIGCIMTMGIVRLPNLKMYWQKTTRLFNVTGIHELFTMTRFQDIMSCFCMRDPKLDTSSDPLEKINPVVIPIISNSQFYYTPKQALSIDESMIPFAGRSKMKQYISSKPCKFGLKAYVIAEAESAYVIKWSLSTGRATNCQTGPGAIERIVMNLVEGLEGEGYIIYTDRHYLSIPLFKALKKDKIGACGTIMQNRLRLSQEASTKIDAINLQEIQYFSTSSMILSVWKDHRNVFVLSNFHIPGEVTKERRIKKKEISQEKTSVTETVSIPISIMDYNTHMGGVDTFDQVASYYVPDIKSRRWYMRVFYHLLEIAFNNSYILYRQTLQKENRKFLDRLEYRKSIIRELVSERRNEKNTPCTEKK